MRFSLTPRFNGVARRQVWLFNRFQRFKTAEAVTGTRSIAFTPLKRGVNKKEAQLDNRLKNKMRPPRAP